MTGNTELSNQTQSVLLPRGLTLNAQQFEIVRQILMQNLPDHQVWAFGSRVTGQARKYSDSDLTVSHPKALPFSKLCQVGNAFEASDLDICVDIVDWSRAGIAFRSSVEQKGMVRIL